MPTSDVLNQTTIGWSWCSFGPLARNRDYEYSGIWGYGQALYLVENAPPTSNIAIRLGGQNERYMIAHYAIDGSTRFTRLVNGVQQTVNWDPNPHAAISDTLRAFVALIQTTEQGRREFNQFEYFPDIRSDRVQHL